MTTSLRKTGLVAATATVITGYCLCAATLRAEPAAVKAVDAAGSFLIPAYAFDRGNAKTFTKEWADAGPMIAYGGVSPVAAVYDIDFPVAATYTIHVRYAAQEPRPVEISLDDKSLGACCRTATGSWNTSSAQWEASCTVAIAAGKHTLKLQRDGSFPHVVSLRLDSSVPFAKDWKLERPKARTLESPPLVPAELGTQYTDVKIPALRLAIQDLVDTFGPQYPGGPDFLKRLDALQGESERLEREARQIPDLEARRKGVTDALVVLRREALLANPLLDFDKLLVVVRKSNSPSLGLPQNWQSNSCLPREGFHDRVAVLSSPWKDGELTTLFEPDKRFVGDVDLHFDANRMLFSMRDDKGRWQIFEIGVDGKGLRQLTGEQPDVDSYDACYLPDGRILFTSTAYFVGVPCVYGSSHVAVLYIMDADGRNIRQLCFDQEHDWCPVVLNNGRVMYQRWEYADTPHSNTRFLFHMNPDGTEQMEYYGSNSYWPNATFFARPIPGHPTKVVGVIGGHHDRPRMGELVIFDPAKGRREAAGAVQRIPGYGKKVEAIISDGLTLNSWPKFLHPYPLSEKHFLVACSPGPQSLWGIYLVDTFDNMVLLKELPGHALFEPLPLRATPRPPSLPDKVDLARKDATVYLPDIYVGDGLKGVPRGTIKSLRIFTYHFAYQEMGGLLGVVGMDGPWDIKRVVGTVPVNEDGSPQNSAPPRITTIALNRPAEDIKPWRGPMRGFSYAREVQPVIDKHCVACHDGRALPDGTTMPDLRSTKLTDWSSITPGNGGPHAGKFTVGYAELHRYVRRPGIESDYHLLEPMEFHADTTERVPMLRKGHHGVKLESEAWDRRITWIVLYFPFNGTWGE
ncbi:MAG: carbohydrate-binding protein [Planctomycetia bacterium]|nr:carbohydrate-binding protein [Planctomycetia bacterium]